jgi:hypothetical protein
MFRRCVHERFLVDDCRSVLRLVEGAGGGGLGSLNLLMRCQWWRLDGRWRHLDLLLLISFQKTYKNPATERNIPAILQTLHLKGLRLDQH